MIADLQDAERSGAFDRDVLLFAQDGYVMRVLAECRDRLAEAFTAANGDSEDPEERSSRKRSAVIAAVLELYARLKEEGDETTGVRGYAGAAAVFLNGAIVDYETYLRDVAQHLEQSVQVGHTPDVGWLAGHTYAVLARASRTIETVEAALGVEAGCRAETLISAGVRAIGSAGQDSVSAALGKQLWRTVEAIDRAPQTHVMNAEETLASTAVLDDVWDIAPAERQEFEP
ncbi:hypothetical protein [Bordetella flabilis]|uniref:hypothetical protein n=1 Tax=Bordetella flabilis TaxID=463014 RepID=UPI0012F4AD31|nr:hypothetical protein [Bordetella flabilis]